MGEGMPDQRVNPLQPESYLAYTGGMNAFASNHRELGPDTLRHLVNGTVRGGWVETRPHFECMIPVFVDEADKVIWETGKIQGSGYYRFGSDAVMVYAIDGNLLAFDPISKKVTNINPPTGAPFSKYADFVYFSTRSGHLISGDGLGRQVITFGYESRFSKSGDPNNEVPISLMMADDWGRLAVVDPDRKRIRFSNHELDPDPTYSPLAFDETFDYYKGSRFFQVPDHVGKIVWIGFLPWLDTDTGTGPLCVMGERATRYYDVSIDRTQWAVQDISGTMLPNIGGLSHRAQVVRADTLIFSDQHGRIRNLKNARQDESTLSVKRFDRAVFPYFEKEPKDLRKFRIAAEWNERVIIGVQPESRWIREGGIPDRYNVRHRGMVVWNGEISEMQDERDLAVWDGLWTGIYPATLDTGQFGVSGTVISTELCIALSVDADGINRPYVIREDGAGRYDIAPRDNGQLARKRIELQMTTRPLDFSSRDGDYSLLLKRLDQGVIRIGERYGKTRMQGYVQSDQDWLEGPWFDHNTNADHDLKFGTVSRTEKAECGKEVTTETCELRIGRPHHDPKIRLPHDYREGQDPIHCTRLTSFYKASVRLVVTGWARIEEFMFSAKKETEENTANHSPCCPEEKKRNTGCNPNYWDYHARTAPPYTCE